MVYKRYVKEGDVISDNIMDIMEKGIRKVDDEVCRVNHIDFKRIEDKIYKDVLAVSCKWHYKESAAETNVTLYTDSGYEIIYFSSDIGRDIYLESQVCENDRGNKTCNKFSQTLVNTM